MLQINTRHWTIMKHTVLSNLIEQGQRDPDSIIRAALDIQALALLLELQFNPVSNGYYDTWWCRSVTEFEPTDVLTCWIHYRLQARFFTIRFFETIVIYNLLSLKEPGNCCYLKRDLLWRQSSSPEAYPGCYIFLFLPHTSAYHCKIQYSRLRTISQQCCNSRKRVFIVLLSEAVLYAQY